MGARLVIIDTWAWATLGADENTAKDSGVSLGRLNHLRRQTGATVLTLHHSTKDGSSERGSSTLRAAMDTVINLSEEGDRIVLTCEKQRNGPKFPPLRLRLDREALVFGPVGASLRSKLPAQQAKVLDALKALSVDGAPVAVLAWRKRCIDVDNISRRTFYDAKDKLTAAGRVEERDNAHFVLA